MKKLLAVFSVLVLFMGCITLPLEKKVINEGVYPKEGFICRAMAVGPAAKPPTGNLDIRQLEITADILKANGLVNCLNNENIFVVRGYFDGWTSFVAGRWNELGPNEVYLKEETGKLLLNTEDLIKRAETASLQAVWENEIKIVVFNKNKKFLAEYRENTALNTLFTSNNPLQGVEVIVDKTVTKTDSIGEAGIPLTTADEQTVKFYKKGYFYKEVTYKELKLNKDVLMNRLQGSLTGDIRYETVDAPEVLGGKRNLTIYLPPEYEKNTDKRYPVIYINDGKEAFDDSNYTREEMRIDETLEELYSEGKISGIIAVAIDESMNRFGEYVPWDWEAGVNYKGLGNEYIEFVKNNVKTYIDNKYRTKPDAENTILTGNSLGGLISLYAAAKNSGTFGKIIAFSPSLDINNFLLEQEIKNGAKAGNSKIYFDVSKLEGGAAELEAMSRIKENFKSIGYDDSSLNMYIAASGNHSTTTWAGRFPAALEWIIKD